MTNKLRSISVVYNFYSICIRLFCHTLFYRTENPGRLVRPWSSLPSRRWCDYFGLYHCRGCRGNFCFLSLIAFASSDDMLLKRVFCFWIRVYSVSSSSIIPSFNCQSIHAHLAWRCLNFIDQFILCSYHAVLSIQRQTSDCICRVLLSSLVSVDTIFQPLCQLILCCHPCTCRAVTIVCVLRLDQYVTSFGPVWQYLSHSLKLKYTLFSIMYII